MGSIDTKREFDSTVADLFSTLQDNSGRCFCTGPSLLRVSELLQGVESKIISQAHFPMFV